MPLAFLTARHSLEPMLRSSLWSLLCALLLALGAPSAAADKGQRYLLDIDGMTCTSCSTTISEALMTIKGVAAVNASHLQGRACIQTEGRFDLEAAQAALKLAGYVLKAEQAVESCPEGLGGNLPAPWDAHSKGLPVKTISTGEEVELDQHLAAESYTIFDFGAPWCAPCHDAAQALSDYLRKHRDVAVRVIDLSGETPEDSYQQPVVAQHLQYVTGVPWFIVHAPKGRIIYRGMEVKRAMAVMDKHRKRAAKARQ